MGGGSTSSSIVVANLIQVGSLTSNGLIYSGFSSSNYLMFADKVSNGVLKWDTAAQYIDLVPMLASADTWEIGCRFKTPTSWTKTYNVVFGQKNNNYRTPQIDVTSSNRKLEFIVSTTGSSWTYSLIDSSDPQFDTWYNAKAGFSGTEYYFYLKTDDDEDYRLAASQESTTKIYNNSEQMIIGYDSGSNPWRSYIDMSQWYIKADGELIWEPAVTFNGFQAWKPVDTINGTTINMYIK